MRIAIVNLLIILLLLGAFIIDLKLKTVFLFSFVGILLIIGRYFYVDFIFSLILGVFYAGVLSSWWYFVLFPLMVILAKFIFSIFEESISSRLLAGVLSLALLYLLAMIFFLINNFYVIGSSINSLSLFLLNWALSAVLWVIAECSIVFWGNFIYHRKAHTYTIRGL